MFTPEQPRPCDSHPCGPNAHCRVNPNSGSAACVCPPDYRGDPYMSCRPECAANSDCPRHRTCLNNRCVDPCAGVCGLESLCRVVNHLPVCGCPQGYMGDPYSMCRPIPVLSKIATDSGIFLQVFLKLCKEKDSISTCGDQVSFILRIVIRFLKINSN